MSTTRCRRGLTSDVVYQLSANDIEDLLHLIRDCPFASEVWLTLLPPHLCSKFFLLGLLEWIEWNVWGTDLLSTSENWTEKWAMVC